MDDDMDQYWTHATDSAKNSTPKVLSLKTMSQARAAQNRSDWIRNSAQQILGSYRRDDFADPDGYLVQLAMVLERYDDAVIRAVTSPITGIQRTHKFPPSIAEFVEFIDEHIRRSTYAASWDERAKKQLEEREQFKREETAEPLEYRRAVAERILKEYHSQLAPETKPQRQTWKRFTAEELLAMYSAKTPAECPRRPAAGIQERED